MAERRKLIVVSNRGPVSYGRENGERVARRGGGGLVTALRGLISHHDVTWIASAISDEDRIASAEPIEETARDGSQFRLRLVAHDESEYDWFYNVIANPILWFLQPYLWELASTRTAGGSPSCAAPSTCSAPRGTSGSGRPNTWSVGRASSRRRSRSTPRSSTSSRPASPCSRLSGRSSSGAPSG